MIAQRMHQVEAAKGVRPLDLLITNVQLVNVFTSEVYAADIGVSHGMIVSVDPKGTSERTSIEYFDGNGFYAIPGLIDTHVHIESSMMNPAGFASAVVPMGTTTVVIDPHEIGNVLGLRGVAYMLEATKNLPLRVYVQAPSSVPAVPALESAGAEFGNKEIRELLSWERVIGLAEVMDYVGVINQNERMRLIVNEAIALNKVISGHCPEVTGKDLAAYLVGGPNSDHEGKEIGELLEKLRSGMTIEGRVSSFSESISVIAKIVRQLGRVPPNLVLCTDDIYPDDLLRKGHLDEVLRFGIREGIAPVELIRAATLNGAIRHRLYDLGAIAPGKRADIVLAENLNDFHADEVFIAGNHVASGGKLLSKIINHDLPIERENTIRLGRTITKSDFVIRVKRRDGFVRQNVLVIDSTLRRSLNVVEFPVKDGNLDISQNPRVCIAAIFERHGKNGRYSLALIEGLGLHSGAAATTVAHDSHNLVILGRDLDDMALAANHLTDCGGGICSVADGKIVGEVQLPIAGLMSPYRIEQIVPKLDSLNAALRAQGFFFAQPLTGLLSLALPVIPAFGMTDMGIVDIARQIIVSDPE